MKTLTQYVDEKAADKVWAVYDRNDIFINYFYTSDDAKSTADVEITAADATFVQWQQQLTSKYTLHGGQYVWNSAAFLDWGALINAVISFLIIAITLFIVVKVVNSLRAARLAAEEKAKAQLEGEKTEEEKPAEEPAE